MNEKIEARLAAIADEAADLEARMLEALNADEFDDDGYDELEGRAVELADEKAQLEARAVKLDAVAALAVKPEMRQSGDGAATVAVYAKKVDPTDVDRVNGSRSEVRDAALALLEREAKRRHLPVSDESVDKIEDMINRRQATLAGRVQFDGDIIARRLLITETDAYRSAWVKGLTQNQPAFTSDEVRALEEFRGASLTDASGGYGVPVLIDPTIVLTTGAQDVPILRVARIETITTDTWLGVSSVPPAWSYDAEAATVSDDSITFAQPSVAVAKAAAFLPFSIEIGMDYPSFAAEMARALAEGYLQKIASQSMTGSSPDGIFTAIDASASREVVVTTSGTLSPVDSLTAWNALGEQYRPNASWFSSVSVESKFRNTGASGGQPSLFTVDMNQDGISRLAGRPYYTTDYAPAFSGTTGTVNLAVVGDFRHFLIAQRAGMSIELVPHLVDVTSNRPTGQRGWYAWARHGFDSINDAAFVLLKNAT